MEDRNKRFLKDLAWSEAWFPWRRENSILVRGRQGNFWEPFALVVSASALFVSAISTYGTWRQVTIMQQQITSGDRNRTFQITMEKLNTVCKSVQSVKLPVYEDPDDMHVLAMLKSDAEEAYRHREKIGDLSEKAEELADSMKSLGLWLTGKDELEQAWEMADRYARAFKYQLGEGENDYQNPEALESSNVPTRWVTNHAFNVTLCERSSRELIEWFRTGLAPTPQFTFSLRSPEDWD